MIKNFSSGSFNSINPITPIGFGKYKGYEYPMQRGVDYTWSDWRTAQDMLINNSMGVRWSELVTWCQQSNYLMSVLPQKAMNQILSNTFYVHKDNGEMDELATKEICEKLFFKDILRCVLMSEFEGFTAFVVNWRKGEVIKYPIEMIDYKNQKLKRQFSDTQGSVSLSAYNAFYVEHAKTHQLKTGLFSVMTRYVIAMARAESQWDIYGQQRATPSMVIGYNNGGASTGYGYSTEELQELYDDSARYSENRKFNTSDFRERQENPIKAEAQRIANNYDASQVYTTPFTYDQNGNIREQIKIGSTDTGSHKSSEAHRSFKDILRYCGEAISVAVMGNPTSIFPDNANRASAEVYRKAEAEVSEERQSWLLSWLNSDFKRKIGISEDLFFGVDKTKKMSLADAAIVSKIAVEQGVRLNEIFFVENLAVPKDMLDEQSFFNKKNISKDLIKDVKDKEEEVVEKREVAKKKKANLGFSTKTEVETETNIKKIIVKPNIKDRNFRYYGLDECLSAMEFSSKAKINQPKKEEYLNCFDFISSGRYRIGKLNKSFNFDLNNYERVEKLGCNLFEETLNSFDECWKIDNKYILLKFYHNVVYCVNLQGKSIFSAKCLRSVKDVELLRVGELIR